MKQYIQKATLIEKAKEKGIDLGRDPGQTLTYYQRQGLIPRPMRRSGGKARGVHAFYHPETLRVLSEIKELQAKGRRLDEIKRILKLRTEETNADFLRMKDRGLDPRKLNAITGDLAALTRELMRKVNELHRIISG